MTFPSPSLPQKLNFPCHVLLLAFIEFSTSFQIATLITNSELRLASELVNGLIQPVKLLPILCFNGYLFQNMFCQCRQAESIEAVATDQEIQEMGPIQ